MADAPKAAPHQVIADYDFLDEMRPFWLLELTRLCGAERAADLMEGLEAHLHWVRTEFGIAAQDVWMALLRGHADAVTNIALKPVARPDA